MSTSPVIKTAIKTASALRTGKTFTKTAGNAGQRIRNVWQGLTPQSQKALRMTAEVGEFALRGTARRDL